MTLGLLITPKTNQKWYKWKPHKLKARTPILGPNRVMLFHPLGESTHFPLPHPFCSHRTSYLPRILLGVTSFKTKTFIARPFKASSSIVKLSLILQHLSLYRQLLAKSHFC